MSRPRKDYLESAHVSTMSRPCSDHVKNVYVMTTSRARLAYFFWILVPSTKRISWRWLPLSVGSSLQKRTDGDLHRQHLQWCQQVRGVEVSEMYKFNEVGIVYFNVSVETSSCRVPDFRKFCSNLYGEIADFWKLCRNFYGKIAVFF